MPARNAAGTIHAAIRSVLGQTACNFELLVLDDASTDRTAAIASVFADTRVRIVPVPAQQGISRRLNAGIDLASGRFIARMDADDWAFPERFARQLAFLSAHPEIDLLGTRAIVVDSAQRLRHAFPFREHHEQICARPWNGFYLCHPTWMGRAEWFRRWRYPEPDCTRAEDQELLLRSYRASRFHCLPQYLLAYRQDVPRLALRQIGRQSLLRAQLTQFRTHREWRAAALACAAYAGKTLADALVPVVRGEWTRRPDRVVAHDADAHASYARFRRLAASTTPTARGAA